MISHLLHLCLRNKKSRHDLRNPNRKSGGAPCAADVNRSSIRRDLEVIPSQDAQVQHESSEDNGDSETESEYDFNMLEPEAQRHVDGSSDNGREYHTEHQIPPNTRGSESPSSRAGFAAISGDTNEGFT
jgi:hypothetical protein